MPSFKKSLIVEQFQGKYLKLFMLWRQFFARVKVNHRSIYSRILARVCAVAMAMELVKNKAYKMVFVYLKIIQYLDCFDCLPTTN